jgi:hypothetical protein
MPKLIFEFETNEIRDRFLGQFCDGGGEDNMYDALQSEGIKTIFDYKKAFKEWGWNGKGDPTITCKRNKDA